MCKIMIFPVGVNPEWEKFQNAVWNNPHGYGLILKDPKNKKLELIKSGEKELKNGNDPKELFDLVTDNDDFERYLHVRWKTEGAISQDNVQPFCSYNSKSRQVYFMHNGTLYEYRNSTGVNHYYQGVRKEAEDAGDSDTKRFNDKFLSPFIQRIVGENGKADFHDPIFQAILMKYWGAAAHNRGVLIANDLDYFLINSKEWKENKTSKGSYFSSNDQYFDKLTRGFEFDRREAERKEIEEKERATRKEQQDKFHTDHTKNIVNLREVSFQKKYGEIKNINDLMTDIDVYSHSGIALLKNLTAVEIQTFIQKNEEDAIALIMHLTDEFAKLYDNHTGLTEYVQKIQKGNSENKRKVG